MGSDSGNGNGGDSGASLNIRPASAAITTTDLGFAAAGAPWTLGMSLVGMAIGKIVDAVFFNKPEDVLASVPSPIHLPGFTERNAPKTTTTVASSNIKLASSATPIGSGLSGVDEKLGSTKTVFRTAEFKTSDRTFEGGSESASPPKGITISQFGKNIQRSFKGDFSPSPGQTFIDTTRDREGGDNPSFTPTAPKKQRIIAAPEPSRKQTIESLTDEKGVIHQTVEQKQQADIASPTDQPAGFDLNRIVSVRRKALGRPRIRLGGLGSIGGRSGIGIAT